MTPIPVHSAFKVVMATVALAWLSMLPVMFLSEISLNVASLKDLSMIFGVLSLFLFYSVWRRLALLPDALLGVAAVLALAVPILVWTYAAMRVNMPLADAQLAAMDAALGFDWHAFVAWIDKRPLLAAVLAYSYAAFPYQLLALPTLLVLLGQPERAGALILTYLLACLVSSLIGIWYPALGTYATYGVAQDSLSNINIWFGYFFIEQFDSVRSAGPFELVLNDSAGILTFPSVHAAVAVVCAWAAWSSRILRYPFLLLNLFMAVSAVSHGSHYLVDVVAGIGVASFCISATLAAFPGPWRQVRPAPFTQPVSRAASSG